MLRSETSEVCEDDGVKRVVAWSVLDRAGRSVRDDDVSRWFQWKGSSVG